MESRELDTTHLHVLLSRLQGGDKAAPDELIRRSLRRLEQLARRMLRAFPHVHRWEDTADVLQRSLLRLLQALQTKRPKTTRDFYKLAANRIRSELLDLVRHYHGPHGLGRHHASGIRLRPADGSALALDPPDRAADARELDRWCAFHEAVEQLPADEREVFGFVYYHGWTRTWIAELFQVDERTVRRRWQSACLKLHELLNGEIPGA